jgi:2-iminobutanoate/2-iminopropanoate deaminase
VGPMIYVAGLTARAPDGITVTGPDEYTQARAIFEKMRHLVTAAGGVMDDIVKLTIFVTDIKEREKVWAARREFFSGDCPACSLVEVSALASPEIRVEIEGVAHLGGGS